MASLKEIHLFRVSEPNGSTFQAALSRNPARLLRALLEHSEGLQEETAARLCDDLPSTLLNVQRAGVRVEWGREDGLALITLSDVQTVEPMRPAPSSLPVRSAEPDSAVS
ncbi:MAG: hypothetical protein ABL308_05850 [Oceanicaulis sp.]